MDITKWINLIAAAEVLGKEIAAGVRGLLPPDVTDEQLNAINAGVEAQAKADADDARRRIDEVS